MPTRSEPIRVLVVDDSEAFLAAARALVEHHPDLRVAGTASSGVEAIEQVSRLRPDLVLMDAFMPVMDGLQATRMLKSQAGAPWVVVVSLHDDEALCWESWAAGADDFIAKSQLADRLPALVRHMRDGGGEGRPRGRGGRSSRRPEPRRSEPPLERRREAPGVIPVVWERLSEVAKRWTRWPVSPVVTGAGSE